MTLIERAAAQLDKARAIRLTRGHSSSSRSMRQIDRARDNLAAHQCGIAR